MGLFLALGAAHAYITVARYDQAEQMKGDPGVYLSMTQGKPLLEVLKVYRWRALTPFAVRAMPFLPEALTAQYQVDTVKIVRFKYALWNTLGCVAAAFALLLFMQALGFSALQAGIGGLLYMSSFQVMIDGATMLVDPWANAAIITCLWLGLGGHRLALALVFAAGIFCKETLVVVAPFLVLLQTPRWKTQLLVLVPGVAAYAWFRYVLLAGGQGVDVGQDWIMMSLEQFTHLRHWAYVAAEFTLNFALLAPLALLGWPASAAYPRIRAMAWLLPALAVTPMVLGTELTRPWFNGFPVFIPLAVLGLWRLGGWDAAPVPVKATKTTRRR